MVDESLILTIKLKDEVTSSIKSIDTSLSSMESKISNINKLALGNTIATTFKNAFDAIEKMNSTIAKYEKQVIQVKEKEEKLQDLKSELIKVQEELNKKHDAKTYERYKELIEQIRLQEEKLAIEKRELLNAQLNLISSTMQLATTTIPNLVASFGTLTNSLGALRLAINATFFTNPIGLAIMGITSGVLALNEVLGFLPFKISDAFNFGKVDDAKLKVDEISTKMQDFATNVDEANEKVEKLGNELKSLSMNELKLEFTKDLGIEDIGGKFFKNVMEDVRKRMLITNPMYFIEEILNSSQFEKALAMVKGGIMPMRTLEANILQTLKEIGLPSQLIDEASLKIKITLQERVNSLTNESNTKLDEQATTYKRLNEEVINTNKSLDAFINKIISLRKEIERMENEIRSRPQPLSISITPLSGGSVGGKTSTISPYPSKPPSQNTILNVGNRVVQKDFTSGMYVY